MAEAREDLIRWHQTNDRAENERAKGHEVVADTTPQKQAEDEA